MGAPRSVIIDIENKGLSHVVAHKNLTKNGMFNAQPATVEAKVENVKFEETKQEPIKVPELNAEETKVEEVLETISVVEETKQEPIKVPELNAENVVKKNAFKKKKNLTDLT